MGIRNVKLVLNDHDCTEVVVRAKGKTSACMKLFGKRYRRCVEDGDILSIDVLLKPGEEPDAQSQ